MMRETKEYTKEIFKKNSAKFHLSMEDCEDIALLLRERGEWDKKQAKLEAAIAKDPRILERIIEERRRRNIEIYRSESKSSG